MSDIEKAISTPSVLGDIERINEVGLLYVKGYRQKEISELLEIPKSQVGQLISEYEDLISYTVANDPALLNRFKINARKLLNELEELSKEAWESVSIATDNGQINARIQALKLASDINARKAQLLNLNDNSSKENREMVERAQKVEDTNRMLAAVIKEVIADCERCRGMARLRLEQAFASMSDYAEAEVIDDDV